MSIQINEYTALVIILILTMLMLTLGLCVIVIFKRLSEASRQLKETNRLLYFIMKDSHIAKEKLTCCMEDISEMQYHLKSLSSGLQIKLEREAEEKRQKKFPKPDVAKQITETIREQYFIQLILMKNQTAPRRDALGIITEHVIRTYPEISPDYLIDKCIAVVEDEISRSISEQ